jgi:hypothetical protein
MAESTADFPYETRLNILHGPLETIDVRQSVTPQDHLQYAIMAVADAQADRRRENDTSVRGRSISLGVVAMNHEAMSAVRLMFVWRKIHHMWSIVVPSVVLLRLRVVIHYTDLIASLWNGSCVMNPFHMGVVDKAWSA